MLTGMTVATWIAAIATLALASERGTALTQLSARWNARAEELRTDEAPRENELHGQRFAEVRNWQREQPEGEERVKSAQWCGEWTGADKRYCGGMDSEPVTTGLHSRSVQRLPGLPERRLGAGKARPAATDTRQTG